MRPRAANFLAIPEKRDTTVQKEVRPRSSVESGRSADFSPQQCQPHNDASE